MAVSVVVPVKKKLWRGNPDLIPAELGGEGF
jgi:hypothetical protein